MNYLSTRDSSVKVSSAQAIAQGISKDSGLFVPETIPSLSMQEIEAMLQQDYTQRACVVLGKYLTDFSEEEIRESVTAAYAPTKFSGGYPAPVQKLNDDTFMLELWHGPTCAFKDMALQLLPHLLTRAVSKVAKGEQVSILVATSGDTGKAALEGFKDVPGTSIHVFYPYGGVSEIQRLQMATQEGANVGVCGVHGNFDDTQTGVKQIFTNADINSRMNQNGKMFSSANSINWGRLVPQIVYYVSAYVDLVGCGEIKMGDKINVAVPTGNFGNILAAYYAKKMGLPLDKFICASNKNNVLTDFIKTGEYDRRRDFFTTASPSMDILISSNLERLLFALYDGDSNAVKALMDNLSAEGYYTVSDEVKAKLQAEFYGGFCDEEATNTTIRDIYTQNEYLMDTHTAVGQYVREKYVEETGDKTITVIASTASPFKFAKSMLYAMRGVESDLDEFEQAEMLAELTKTEIPEQILQLKEKVVRFDTACDVSKMTDYVCEKLGI